MNSESYDIFIQPNYFRIIHQPENDQDPIYCLIHGWSGNEHSMSVFLPSLNRFNYCFFPRAIFKISENQFGWINVANSTESFKDYEQVSIVLYQSIQQLLDVTVNTNPSQKINLIGFSQGAVISVVLGILYPEKFSKIALIAGFLPDFPPEISDDRLAEIDFFIAHGTKDQIVKFDRALELRDYLRNAGASAQFCPEDLEHKIGKNCLRNLKIFFDQ